MYLNKVPAVRNQCANIRNCLQQFSQQTFEPTSSAFHYIKTWAITTANRLRDLQLAAHEKGLKNYIKTLQKIEEKKASSPPSTNYERKTASVNQSCLRLYLQLFDEANLMYNLTILSLYLSWHGIKPGLLTYHEHAGTFSNGDYESSCKDAHIARHAAVSSLVHAIDKQTFDEVHDETLLQLKQAQQAPTFHIDRVYPFGYQGNFMATIHSSFSNSLPQKKAHSPSKPSMNYGRKKMNHSSRNTSILCKSSTKWENQSWNINKSSNAPANKPPQTLQTLPLPAPKRTNQENSFLPRSPLTQQVNAKASGFPPNKPSSKPVATPTTKKPKYSGEEDWARVPSSPNSSPESDSSDLIKSKFMFDPDDPRPPQPDNLPPLPLDSPSTDDEAYAKQLAAQKARRSNLSTKKISSFFT